MGEVDDDFNMKFASEPMSISFQLLKMRNNKKKEESALDTLREQIQGMNRPAIEQLEEPIMDDSFIDNIEPSQLTLPMPLPLNANLLRAIRNRDDMKIDNRNYTFTRRMPGLQARRKFQGKLKDRMRFKEGRPTPTKVEVRGLGNDRRKFVLTDDDGKLYSSVKGTEIHPKDMRRIRNVTNTIVGLNAGTPEEYRRRGYYKNLLDTLLQNKIGIVSDNRNPEFSQPFHEKFQQRLPTNITARGAEFDRSKTFQEAAERADNMYRYGHDPEFEERALENIDTTGWGDLKPMFGNQYPMFGTVDKPIHSLTDVSPRSSIRVQDNTDPSSPSLSFYRQSTLTDPRFDPNAKKLKDLQDESREKLDDEFQMSRAELERMFG